MYYAKTALFILSLVALTHSRANAVEVIINANPQPPIVEMAPPVAPAPRPGFVWVEGVWVLREHRRVWAPGYWVAARPGYRYAHRRWYRH